MRTLLQKSGKNLFNSIYIEEQAYNYPVVRMVLEKYPDIPVITIRNYKDVFNRGNQCFQLQKHRQSLILAVKSSPFLYKGPEVCQDFGYSDFYYTSFLFNCIFDCEYCYLQGMYPSANVVAFVNVDEFKQEIENTLGEKKAYLAVSYDTDLIGFHNIIPYWDFLQDFFTQYSDINVEIRTKSANEVFYNEFLPAENIVVAFSLAPQEIIQKYERLTPPLSARIKAVKTAIFKGFKVRLCLDPVIINSGSEKLYEPFFRNLFMEINPDKLKDVGYGFFRMSKDFFKRIEKQKSDSQLYADQYSITDNIVSYPNELREQIMTRHLSILEEYLPKEKIFTL
ncbi:SPL family radical SAM protein [Ruminiclostridium papyrosolvens]|uniref:DNA repair photolyase n=1 Tax=Ruminiclostridium papyrosolvens C7 TaxID=1330534 RepID=U4R400_9FIRM|nr:deoxyribodipyrimidine photo-lyase [Ruminiclostridium papyrosolvens]EPR12705.1 DNA repair photolyase [Ruminiclostridium papyrosolvens C7]